MADMRYFDLSYPQDLAEYLRMCQDDPDLVRQMVREIIAERGGSFPLMFPVNALGTTVGNIVLSELSNWRGKEYLTERLRKQGAKETR